MADSGINQDEFIDLYEELGLPVKADAHRIRNKINELYLEAQQNLDHRNPKKRIGYQQLYEIILPQARHLLLDDTRRAEYDRYWKAFKSKKRVEHKEESSAPPHEITPQKTVTEQLEEEGVSTEELEARREAMWQKWKVGLEEDIKESAPPEPTPEEKRKEEAAKREAERKAKEKAKAAKEAKESKEEQGGFNQAALRSAPRQQLSVAEQKRREARIRQKNINAAAQSAFTNKAILVGAGALIISAVALYFGIHYLIANEVIGGSIAQAAEYLWAPVAVGLGIAYGITAGNQAKQETIDRMQREFREKERQRTRRG